MKLFIPHPKRAYRVVLTQAQNWNKIYRQDFKNYTTRKQRNYYSPFSLTWLMTFLQTLNFHFFRRLKEKNST